MCFAEGFALSTGFVIILIAHLAAVMTHIALGNELIVSKVSSISFSYACIPSMFSKNIFRVLINYKRSNSLVLVKVRDIFSTCQLPMKDLYCENNIHSLTIFTKRFHDALRKIPKFYLISWCRNFVERHSFRRVSSYLPKSLQKLCLSTKFPHQEIR